MATTNQYASKAKFWFTPDAVSEKLQIKNCNKLIRELTTTQTKGSVGSSEGSKSYTESGPTGLKVENDLELTLAVTSVASLKSLMKWIEKYQNPSYTGGAAEEVEGTTAQITFCNHMGQDILTVDLEGLIPMSCSSPPYKAEMGDLEYKVKCRYIKMKPPQAVK